MTESTQLRTAMAMDRANERLIVWVTVALSASLLVYHDQTAILASKAVEMASGTFDTIYPMVAIFFSAVFLLLRWQDLHLILLKEQGTMSRPEIRLMGLLLILSPLALAQDANGSVALSAATLVMVWYGASLATNPLTFDMLLPYVVLCEAAALSPSLIESILGDPLGNLTSFLTRSALNISGISILWEGTGLELVSKTGETIRLTIAPACSGITYITTFLLLCGLMHIDLRKSMSSTLMLASVGTVALMLLNALRLAIVIWAGYANGSEALWNLHSWIGYAIFIVFYSVAALAYLKMGKPSKPVMIAVGDTDGELK